MDYPILHLTFTLRNCQIRRSAKSYYSLCVFIIFNEDKYNFNSIVDGDRKNSGLFIKAWSSFCNRYPSP